MQLKRIRLERGLTQERLADLSGVSRPAIHRIENGQQVPRRKTVTKLAKVLDIHPADIAPELFTKPGGKPPGVKVTPKVQKQFDGYIATLARRIARSEDDVEDLKGAGQVGLVEACRKFKETGGMAFDPWVKYYVRNRILDEAGRHYEGNEQTYALEDTLPPEFEGQVPDGGSYGDD
jgi:transcriptional regulator with XRE-family HTH domain